MYLRTPKWKGGSYGSQGWNTEDRKQQERLWKGEGGYQGVAMQEFEAPMRIQSLS